jgi:hypothetical protein
MWPPPYEKEFNRRFKLFTELARGNNWEQVKPFYAENPIDWINDFCVTYDPRNKPPKPKTIPFVLFKRQREFITCLQECVDLGESMLCEKSRDMGASWLCCGYSVHQWYFTDGSSIGWGSRKQELVDKLGDPDSIFQKMRIIIDNLPKFHLPDGFDLNSHANFMKIINPENGSTITGEAGDNIGRGGRKMLYFKDEAAHYERPEKIEAALGDTTDVQVDISSVNGTNNVFYRRRQAGEVWYPDKIGNRGKVRVFIMDWRDHPLKDQEWYERRKAKAEAEGLMVAFAQEVDRDYSSAVEGIIIEPKWVKASIDAHKKLGITDDGEKRAALDLADGGRDKHAWACSHGVILKQAIDWARGDPGKATRRAVGLCQEYGVTSMSYDSIGVGAAAKSEANRMVEEKTMPAHLSITPWNAGISPLDPDKNIILGDRQSPKNKDYFENLSIQAYHKLAQRFYKTYLAVTQGHEYPHDELISICSTIEKLDEIVTELSQAQQTYSKKGKKMLVKAPDGAKSPNLADAIKMCYCPIRKGVDYSKLVMM